jgi:hypothetical protein
MWVLPSIKKKGICLLGRNGEGEVNIAENFIRLRYNPIKARLKRFLTFVFLSWIRKFLSVWRVRFLISSQKGLGPEANLLREYNLAVQKLGENSEDEKLGEEVDRLQA